jgi:hypothetical protein
MFENIRNINVRALPGLCFPADGCFSSLKRSRAPHIVFGGAFPDEKKLSQDISWKLEFAMKDEIDEDRRLYKASVVDHAPVVREGKRRGVKKDVFSHRQSELPKKGLLQKKIYR